MAKEHQAKYAKSKGIVRAWITNNLKEKLDSKVYGLTNYKSADTISKFLDSLEGKKAFHEFIEKNITL